MSNINVQLLIRMVEQHPELYDPSVPAYCDAYRKKETWDNITRRVMSGDWEQLTVNEQQQRVNSVKVRWKSLRDRFGKDLASLSKQPSGSAARKTKTHIFFEELQFLRTIIEKRATSSNVPDSVDSTVDSADTVQLDDLPEDKPKLLNPSPQHSTSSVVEATRSITEKRPGLPIKKPLKKGKLDSANTEILDALGEVRNQLRECRERDGDGDDSILGFLKSLVFDIRQIPAHRISSLKLDMMKLVHSYVSISNAPSSALSVAPSPAHLHSLTPPQQSFHQNMGGFSMASYPQHTILSETSLKAHMENPSSGTPRTTTVTSAQYLHYHNDGLQACSSSPSNQSTRCALPTGQPIKCSDEM